MSKREVGVIGGGVMGSGIAVDLARTGHMVSLVELSDEALLQAKERMRQYVRLARLLPKTEPNPPLDLSKLVTLTCDLAAVAQASIVIEAVPEKWEVKAQTFRLLDQVCGPNCILASNTSAISITRLASLTRRPGQVIGIHFMNPSPLRGVVEVVVGATTSESTVATIRQFLAEMRKESVLVKDTPGFVSNRILMIMVNEAANLVQEQVATAEQIDTVFRQCLGHKMGPLETADLIGLDVIVDTLAVLRESFGDTKYVPSVLLRRLVDAGWHGKKSGRGFFEYG